MAIEDPCDTKNYFDNMVQRRQDTYSHNGNEICDRQLIENHFNELAWFRVHPVYSTSFDIMRRNYSKCQTEYSIYMEGE